MEAFEEKKKKIKKIYELEDNGEKQMAKPHLASQRKPIDSSNQP